MGSLPRSSSTPNNGRTTVTRHPWFPHAHVSGFPDSRPLSAARRARNRSLRCPLRPRRTPSTRRRRDRQADRPRHVRRPGTLRGRAGRLLTRDRARPRARSTHPGLAIVLDRLLAGLDAIGCDRDDAVNVVTKAALTEKVAARRRSGGRVAGSGSIGRNVPENTPSAVVTGVSGRDLPPPRPRHRSHAWIDDYARRGLTQRAFRGSILGSAANCVVLVQSGSDGLSGFASWHDVRLGVCDCRAAGGSLPRCSPPPQVGSRAAHHQAGDRVTGRPFRERPVGDRRRSRIGRVRRRRWRRLALRR